VQAIGKCLPAVFKRHVRRAEPQLAGILAPLWTQVAGQGIAEHSRPETFWGGTLTLATPSETWAAQLRLLAPEILAAVNAFLGTPVVKELLVRLAPDLPRDEEPRETKMPPGDPREFRGAECEFPGGLDPETKDVLHRSFAKYFARGERGQA
jgi:hypothetical protein